MPGFTTDDGSDSLLGTTLDERYVMRARIGGGGMGSVFSAVQVGALEREVAIKVLNAELVGDASVLARFEAEARIIAELRHPNTLRLVDSGRLPDGRLYLVTDRLHGASLDQLLAERPLGVSRTLRIMIQICGSLAEAHQRGIVHRDIKPSNIFIESVADQDVAKVLDFGIAKVERGPALTNPQNVIGTPGYMSPEQCQAEPLDARSDIYSLGAVCFECIAGRPPFEAEADNLVGLMIKHVQEPAPRLSAFSHLASIDPTVDQLVADMLSKERASRPDSVARVAHVMSEALARVRHGGTQVLDSGAARAASSSARGPRAAGPAAFAPTLARAGEEVTFSEDTEAEATLGDEETTRGGAEPEVIVSAEETEGTLGDATFSEDTETGRTLRTASGPTPDARRVQARSSRRDRWVMRGGLVVIFVGLLVTGVVLQHFSTRTPASAIPESTKRPEVRLRASDESTPPAAPPGDAPAETEARTSGKSELVAPSPELVAPSSEPARASRRKLRSSRRSEPPQRGPEPTKPEPNNRVKKPAPAGLSARMAKLRAGSSEPGAFVRLSADITRRAKALGGAKGEAIERCVALASSINSSAQLEKCLSQLQAAAR